MPISYGTVFVMGLSAGWVVPAVLSAAVGATTAWLFGAPRSTAAKPLSKEELAQVMRDVMFEEGLVKAP